MTLSNFQSNQSRQAGFTLIEIILVVLIIGIGTAAIVPMAMDSLEGARLREATRTVVSLNKYARAKAVLLRKPVGILYDIERSTVELIVLPPQGQDLGPFLDSPRLRMDPEMGDLEDEDSLAEQRGGIESLSVKKIGDYVVVQEVKHAEVVDGTAYALYYPSGMCDGHTVTLRDNRDDTEVIRIESMTGDIKVGEAW